MKQTQDEEFYAMLKSTFDNFVFTIALSGATRSGPIVLFFPKI